MKISSEIIHPHGLIDLICVDNDGTLFGSEPLHRQAEQYLFFRLGIDVSPIQHSKYAGWTFEQMLDDICAIKDIRIDKEDADFIVRGHLAELAQDNLRPFDGALELLSQARSKGISLVMTTNGSAYWVGICFSLYPALSSLFDAVVTRDDVIRGKPDVEMFYLAKKRAGLDDGRWHNIIGIDDTVSGLLGMWDFGAIPVAVSTSLSIYKGAEKKHKEKELAQYARRVYPSIGDISVNELQELVDGFGGCRKHKGEPKTHIRRFARSSAGYQ